MPTSGWLRRSGVRVVAGVVATGAVALGVAPPAVAAGGDYGEWSLGAGSVSFPVSGFPHATFTTTSSGTTTPSGNSTYLNAATPFGAEFGSSKAHNYLLVHTASGGAPSITKVTFDHPAPAGHWGFALGDIDADRVHVSAVDENGAPVTGAELGWQGAFNYCATAPKPGTCTRPPFTDEPSWNSATSTLVGHVADSDGAAGWFRPTVPVRSITFTFAVQSGIPVGQIWMAALPVSDPSPTPTPTPMPTPTPTQPRPVALPVSLPEGATEIAIPLPPVGGLPVSHVHVVRKPADGTLNFHNGALVYHADPGCPSGGVDRFTFEAKNRHGGTALRSVRITYKACHHRPTPKPTPVSATKPPRTPVPSASATASGGPALAETGADSQATGLLVVGAAGLLGTGGVLVLLARRRRGLRR